MMKYLRLIRLPNLLMVPLTMYLMHYGIVEPALRYGYSDTLNQAIEPQFTGVLLVVLVLINVFLGAAGYVINDYFDRKIDTINRPKKVIIGKTVHRRFAIILHFTLNALAILLSAYLAWVFKKPFVVLVYVMIAGVFWLYSTTYKHQFLLGNLIVAAGTAMIPFQMAYFELTALLQEYGELFVMHNMSLRVLFYWLSAFALFAFITNLIREIVKDIEDFEGDSSYGSNTIPVVLGINAAKIIVSFLSISMIVLLGYFYFKYLNDSISGIYLLASVGLPMVFVSVWVFFCNQVEQYHRLSWLIKIIMLTGVLFAWVARIVMTNNFN